MKTEDINLTLLTWQSVGFLPHGTSSCLTLSGCRQSYLPCNKHIGILKKQNEPKTNTTVVLFHSWHKCLFLHYAHPLVPLIFFSAMETAHPPSSVSTLWSWAGCTHAPLIGSSALSGVSWMCAFLTRIPKPPQKLLRWGGSGKTTLGFWLFLY